MTKENFSNNFEKARRIKNYYAILGVSKIATLDEIRAAFRKRAQETHPDKPENRIKEEEFKDVNEAYQVLSDSEKRKHYDSTFFNTIRASSSKQETVRQQNPPVTPRPRTTQETATGNYNKSSFGDDWIGQSEKAAQKMMDDIDRGNKEFQKLLEEQRRKSQEMFDNICRQSEKADQKMMDDIYERDRRFRQLMEETRIKEKEKADAYLGKQKKQSTETTK
jgi:curved DNA-binding protein CbpA